MKKIITILCIFALMLGLYGCGGKIRALENYAVGQYGGGWSVLYTDEDGVEEIVALGAAEQPLVIEKGRIYFTEGGRLVSVDMEGKDRQENAIGTMSAGAVITFVDEESFYCVAEATDLTCWRISKADVTAWEEMTIPRAFRQVDYAALLTDIRAAAAAQEDQIRIRSARVSLDSNGSLAAMELEILSYTGTVGTMKIWNSGQVTVAMTTAGPTVDYTDLNIPLSLGDATVKRTITLEDYLTAVEATDRAEIAAGRAQGTPEGFRLMYLTAEYEACIAGNKAALSYVDTTGGVVDADESARHFVLSQVGGCDTILTDSEGTGSGNLTVVQIG